MGSGRDLIDWIFWKKPASTAKFGLLDNEVKLIRSRSDILDFLAPNSQYWSDFGSKSPKKSDI